MRFYEEMLRLAEKLTIEGYIVLMPYASKHAIEHRIKETEEMLDAMHRVKIDMSEEVIIVDCDTDETVYIGYSTANEIEYSRAKGKKLTYYSSSLR
jgi:hypothetical protein